MDLADALEIAGAQVAFTASEAAGTLDRVEDELFRFGRVLAAQPQLQAVLDDPGLPADRKVAVLDDLLADRVDPSTLMLLRHVVRTPRRRTLEEAVATLKTVPPDSQLVRTARDVGISFGAPDEESYHQGSVNREP